MVLIDADGMKLKITRVGGWLEVVKQELGLESWWDYEDARDGGRLGELVVKMVRAVVMGRGAVSRLEWRGRMRVCWRCPVYGRRARVCRLVDGDRWLGCGCYVPFMALVRAPYPRGCWWREKVGEDGGWPALI